MMKNKYWIGFSAIEQIDSTFVQRLYNYFGDIESAYNASLNDLKTIDGLSVRKANTFLRERDKMDLDKICSKVYDEGINFIPFDSEEYPYMLRQISNPPMILYYKGDLQRCNFEKTLAVVGSRRASLESKRGLNKILSGFAGTDICIVSGLASGADTAAHMSAIENGLSTIGVIASGFDYTYPIANRDLYKRIENSAGVIFTEYYPTFEPLKFRFPQRNRIVSGLSYGTLVVEAAMRSGALITANLTLEQGRELLCLPGSISNPNTEGIFKLLKDGATMVTEVDDILNALNWQITKTSANNNTSTDDFTPDESKVIDAVSIESMGFDEIKALTGIKVEDLLMCLTTLELKGIIKQVPGDRYIKA